jgi:hypothetical protein
MRKQMPNKYRITSDMPAGNAQATCKAIDDFLAAHCGITCATSINAETAALNSAIALAKKKQTCQSRLAKLDLKFVASVSECGSTLLRNLNIKMASNDFKPNSGLISESASYEDMLPATQSPTKWRWDMLKATPSPGTASPTSTRSPSYVTNPPLYDSSSQGHTWDGMRTVGWDDLHLTLSSYQDYTDAKFGCGCQAEFTRALAPVDEQEYQNYKAADSNIKKVQCGCLSDAVCKDKDFMSDCGEFLYGSGTDQVQGMPLVTDCTIECKSNTGMIVGITIGVILVVAAVAAFFVIRSRQAHGAKTASATADL